MLEGTWAAKGYNDREPKQDDDLERRLFSTAFGNGGDKDDGDEGIPSAQTVNIEHIVEAEVKAVIQASGKGGVVSAEACEVGPGAS